MTGRTRSLHAGPLRTRAGAISIDPSSNMNITRITARPAVDALLQDKRRVLRHNDSLRMTAARDLIASIAHAMTRSIKESGAPNGMIDPAPGMERQMLEVK